MIDNLYIHYLQEVQNLFPSEGRSAMEHKAESQIWQVYDLQPDINSL